MQISLANQPRWVEVEKTWSEFSATTYNNATGEWESEICGVGVLVDVRDSSTGEVVRHLIGDVNVLGGGCDDCPTIRHDDVVIRALDLGDAIDAFTALADITDGKPSLATPVLMVSASDIVEAGEESGDAVDQRK